MTKNNLTIGICNYNTAKLTNQVISTLIPHLPQDISWQMLILDNSDIEKFKLYNKNPRITIIDNTTGKYINCNKIVSDFCKIPIKHSNNGSLKHCFCIQWLLNICTTRDFLLCDSDIVVNSDIDFINPQYATCAHIQYHNAPTEKRGRSFGQPYQAKTRLLPYIQYFNVHMLRNNSISYFNPVFMHGGMTKFGNYYDTGAFFYQEIYNNLPIKEFDYNKYITHYGAASWEKFDITHKYT